MTRPAMEPAGVPCACAVVVACELAAAVVSVAGEDVKLGEEDEGRFGAGPSTMTGELVLAVGDEELVLEGVEVLLLASPTMIVLEGPIIALIGMVCYSPEM